MDADGLKQLFEPFGEVTVKRMFGGAGRLCRGPVFAIELDGEVFLKVDARVASRFRRRRLLALHLRSPGASR